MADANPGVVEATTVIAAKLGSGLLGSLAALRWLPKESTWIDRLIAFASGIATAVIVGPAIAEISNASSTLEYAIVFLVGLFGMAVVGELMSAIRDVQLGAIAGSWIRKLLGLGG